jgi:small nuclear ribonucleoprotein (snRNP)-like protein|tara:strand:+ start:221 stop:457 length:237 start_codon:yes stop_codon:yes gene_type:complete
MRGFMSNKLIGKWVMIELVNGTLWTGKLEEMDDEAVFISNGFEFGHDQHKGAECTNDEVAKIIETDSKEFNIGLGKQH